MNIKKTMSVILSILMILSLSVTSLASGMELENLEPEQNFVQPRYAYIRTFSASISVSGNKITGCTNIETDTGTTSIVRMYIEKNINSLRQQLSDSGVNVNTIQIKTAGQEGSTQYDGNQNLAKQQEENYNQQSVVATK